MVMAWHGVVRPTAEVAVRCLDGRHGIFGNWVQACMAAASYGLAGRVVAMARLRDLLPSSTRQPAHRLHRLRGGPASRAPLPRTDGHLVVVRGVTPRGELSCCDPAASDAAGGLVDYPAEAFARAWKGVAIAVGPWTR